MPSQDHTPGKPGIGGRVSRAFRDGGIGGLARHAWMRAWMLPAAVPLLGRACMAIAALGARPHFGRHRLATMHRRGWVAPSARITHDDLTLGEGVFVGERVVIYKDTLGGPVRVGDRVRLNREVVVQVGRGGSLTIGPRTSVQMRCLFSAYHSHIEIGAAARIAPHCRFYPYEHGIAAGIPIEEQPLTSRGEIVVGPGAWLGDGVIVLSGARIGAGAVIGAGSVVTGVIPDDAVAHGVPARVVGTRPAA